MKKLLQVEVNDMNRKIYQRRDIDIEEERG